MQSRNAPPSYPAIRFIVRHGDLLAVLVALAAVAAGICAVAAGLHFSLMIAGLVIGGLLWLVLRSYVEVLRILSDTLMPR